METMNEMNSMAETKSLVTIWPLNKMAQDIHERNVAAGWWSDLKFEDKVNSLVDKGFEYNAAQIILETLGITRSTIKTRNKGELLALVHSEVSEAMEGVRKNLMDDKLPHRTMFEVELADTIIRILDMAGAYNLDLDGAIAEKIAYNSRRADHKPENRVAAGGKAF